MSASSIELVPAERIQSRIIVLRGQRVLLDSDLAEIYGVQTKRLIEQMKRNAAKFPEDFVFQLSKEEFQQLQVALATKPNIHNQELTGRWSQNATTLSKYRRSKNLPYAFTEYGAIQAANILRSETAVQMSIAVVRAFVALRQLMVNHKALSSKLAELEARVGAHDESLAAIVEAIRALSEPVPPEHARKIGFHPGNR